MTYEQAVEKIHSLLTFGSRPGLDRILTLLDRMGNPQNGLKFIHVAGTNGKGSVCAMLSSVLTCAGYKTGLFISPYITDFRERIQINNEPVSKKMLADAVEKTFPLVEQLCREGVIITEFEYVNALEFYIHSVERCDIVVLETGMGGLLDCTNTILPPLCSVITSIGLDHTAILGDTIEKISEQKCGIIKKNSIAVTSRQGDRAMAVIKDTAERLKVPLFQSGDIEIKIIFESLEKTVFEYKNRQITLRLTGRHQLENAKTALAVFEALNERKILNVSAENISNGFARAVNPARLELLSKSPVILLDGAHNPNGMEALKNAVIKFLPGEKKICLIGMLSDKDSESSICLLKGLFDEVITVAVDNPRTLTAEQLAEKCRKHFDCVTPYDNTENAVKYAVNKAKSENKALIICGSLYLAGEIRPQLLQTTDKK